MITIRISEQEQAGWASVSFAQGHEFRVQIADPYSEDQRKTLEWYFEQYIRQPFARPGEELAAARSLQEGGEALFNQIFGEREIYAQYVGLPAGDFRFEISGSPGFHAIPWELLWEPKQGFPLSYQVPIVRRNLIPVREATPKPAPLLRILLVVARPRGPVDVGYRTISLPLIESLRNAAVPTKIEVVRPGSWAALQARLAEKGPGYYHVLHFDGHGELRDDGSAVLFFEGPTQGVADPVPAQAFANAVTAAQVPVVILNACESGRQVGASESSLASHVVQCGAQSVVAMSYSCTVTAARLFMTALYGELFAGKPLEAAVLAARQGLWRDKSRAGQGNQKVPLEDWALPVVYQNQCASLALREMTIKEQEEYYIAQDSAHPFPPNFHGRDGDVLEIERRILAADGNSNLLYLQGEVRCGVTSLLNHLAAWWQATGLCGRIFFFGEDDRKRSRAEILDRIAEQLLSLPELANFRALSDAAKPGRLRQSLAQNSSLIVVDRTDPAEADALNDFVTKLSGSKCLVLFGGVAKPEWFPGEPYQVNRLPGMPDVPEPGVRADVFLAETNASLQQSYVDPLQTELVKHKFSVFHQHMGATREEIEKKTNQVLEFAKLAVFVVGPLSSRAPEGAGSVLEIQYDAVMSQKIPCVVWITSSEADPRQKQFIEKLRSQPNRDLLDDTKKLEEVRQRVLDILRQPVAAATAASPAEDWQVYFFFGPEEPKFPEDPPPVAALEIRKQLLKPKKFRVTYPLIDAGATPQDRREVHEGRLQSSRSVVLYWNRASERWVTEQIADILKKAGSTLARNAVLITGELSDAKRGFDDADFPPFQDPEKLIAYLAGEK